MEPLTPEQIVALQAELDATKKSYAALEGDHLKALEAIEALTNENADHKTRAASIELQNEGLQKDNKKLLSDIDEANAEISTLQSKLGFAESIVKELSANSEEKQKAEPPSFKHKGKEYEVIIPSANIPGIGKRTAREIAVDEDAQAYLVKENAIGTVIREKQ